MLLEYRQTKSVLSRSTSVKPRRERSLRVRGRDLTSTTQRTHIVGSLSEHFHVYYNKAYRSLDDSFHISPFDAPRRSLTRQINVPEMSLQSNARYTDTASAMDIRATVGATCQSAEQEIQRVGNTLDIVNAVSGLSNLSTPKTCAVLQTLLSFPSAT